VKREKKEKVATSTLTASKAGKKKAEVEGNARKGGDAQTAFQEKKKSNSFGKTKPKRGKKSGKGTISKENNKKKTAKERKMKRRSCKKKTTRNSKRRKEIDQRKKKKKKLPNTTRERRGKKISSQNPYRCQQPREKDSRRKRKSLSKGREKPLVRRKIFIRE